MAACGRRASAAEPKPRRFGEHTMPTSSAQRREMIHVATSVAGSRPLAGRTYSLQRRRAYFSLRTCKRVLALGAHQSERVLHSRGDVLPVPGGVQGAAAAARPGGLPRHDRRAVLLLIGLASRLS